MSIPNHVRRGLKALLLGSFAAAIGAATEYAIMSTTGSVNGLVSIAVGILIGGAVKMGAERRGGWLYQLMALFLTYTAIAATHAPELIGPFYSIAALGAETEVVPDENSGDIALGAETDIYSDEAFFAALGNPDWSSKSILDWLMSAGLILGLAYAFPFFVAISLPIRGLMYALALGAAWWLNKKIRVVFDGP